MAKEKKDAVTRQIFQKQHKLEINYLAENDGH